VSSAHVLHRHASFGLVQEADDLNFNKRLFTSNLRPVGLQFNPLLKTGVRRIVPYQPANQPTMANQRDELMNRCGASA